ncbi:M50 family metallopeptidase [Ralstonia sp. 22086]|uniref:M50 family metallopeptidase n=1 Tax=Ralstonia sp. 22086 TaxID=3453870 RepID=UPI000FD162BE|nr:hypothetical protein CFM90_16180 [Ralstonia solanacearum]
MNEVVIDAATQVKNRTKRGVALHEAGHFVVARALGFQVLGLKVSRDQPRSELHSGSAHIFTVSKIADDQDLEEFLRERITVLLAGGLAQAFDGVAVNERRLRQIRADNAADDMGKARELFVIHLSRRMTRGYDDEFASSDTWERHPLWKRCEADALAILREQWGAIERIVGDIEANIHSQCYSYDPPVERILKRGWPEGEAAAG